MANVPAWLYPVSQVFGGGALGFTEKGTDYATPFHTPVAAPFAGTVIGESYGGYGGEVDIAVSRGPAGVKTETLLHLDQIQVLKGQTIEQGQQVGLSGGQNVGGSHPATPQYSTGPHTEIDLWKGAPWSSPSVNPDPILKGLGPMVFAAKSETLTPPAASSSQPGWNPLTGFLPSTLPQPGAGWNPWTGWLGLTKAGQPTWTGPNPAQPIVNVISGGASGLNEAVTNAGHGIADFFGVAVEDIGIFLKKQIVALAVAAVVLLILFS